MSDKAIINQSTLDSIGSLLVRNNIAHSPVTPMGMVEALAAMHPLPQYPHPWVMKDAVTLSDDTHLWYYFDDDEDAFAYFFAQFSNPVSGAGFFAVDWGDGTTEQIAVTATLANKTLSHRYLRGGEYHVVISGYDAIRLTNNTFSSSNQTTGNLRGGLAIRQAQFGNTYDRIAFTGNCLGFGLRYIAFQNKATSIGVNAFASSPLLREIDLSACTSIGGSAFNGCTSLASVGDLSSCTSIGGSAFSGCSSLVSVGDMPLLVVLEGYSCFQGCSSLVSIGEMPSCTRIARADGNSLAFGECTSLTSARFSACEYVGGYIFRGCTSMRTLEIPACKTFNATAFASWTPTLLVFSPQTSTQVVAITGFTYIPARQSCVIRCADGDFYRSGSTLVPLT